MKISDGEFVRYSDLPDLCKPEHIAAYFDVTKPTVMTWLRSGKFPEAFKIGGSYRIPKESVRAYAESKYGKVQEDKNE